MSLKYEVLKKLVKLIGIKKRFMAASAEEIVAKAKKDNAVVRIPSLKDAEIEVSRIDVMGFPVLKMIHREKVRRANLFLIGGGMIHPPRPMSIKKALKVAKESGLDLFVPYYPLCTDYPITKAYAMIHETYKLMLREYEAENISVLGTSSGGNLALGIPAYINANHLDVPMPGHILALSPGTCPANDEEWERMKALDAVDVAIPVSYMKMADVIMRHGSPNVPDYMIYLQTGDFTNCPPVTFMYGSDEVLYGAAPSFEAAMKKYGVPYKMIVGQGMFHCYPVFPLVKEAKEGWDQMIEILKKGC